MRFIFLFLLFSVCVVLNGRSNESVYVTKKNLSAEWKVFDGNHYVQAGNDQTNTLYIQVDPLASPKHYLVIQSTQLLDIFIDSHLVANKVVRQIFSLDSLSKAIAGKPFLVAIHSEKPLNLQQLTTTLSLKSLAEQKASEDSMPEQRMPTSFRDFVIVALILLFGYWVVSIRVSPRLFADYFSITKLFFGRETEDYQYFRITSATILFYGFSCLALSLFFFVIDHFYDIPVVSGITQTNSFPLYVAQWLLLSVVLFCALLFKIAILFLLASAFDINEIAGYQFFNFMRLLLIVLVLVTVSISSYYLLHGLESSVYQIFYKILGWVMFFWIAIIFLKLVARVPFSPIQLFLYICATEIIPFLVTVKILYK